jgi:hypothetical protein
MKYIEIILFLALPIKNRSTTLIDLTITLWTYRKYQKPLEIIEDENNGWEIYINFPIPLSQFKFGPFTEWDW